MRVVTKSLVFILMCIGLYSSGQFALGYFRKTQAKKVYKKNIFLIQPGMGITSARNLMGEFQFKERLGPKVEYIVDQDSTVLIRLVYLDDDSSDGFPSITFNPQTNEVVYVALGESF